MPAEVNSPAASEAHRTVTLPRPPAGKWFAARRVVYKLSWLPLFTLATTRLGFYFIGVLSDVEFPAPEIGLLVAPVGLIVGWKFGRATLERPYLHVLLLLSSGVTVPLLAKRANLLYEKSKSLRGTGLFSGLGEALEALFFNGLSVAAVAIAIGSLTMLFDRWRAEPTGNTTT